MQSPTINYHLTDNTVIVMGYLQKLAHLLFTAADDMEGINIEQVEKILGITMEEALNQESAAKATSPL